MVRICTLSLLFCVSISTYCRGETPPRELVCAIGAWESRGNDWAIGDKHLKNKAYGSHQIRKGCLDDVNRVWGTKYRPEDMLGNRALSMKVYETYIGMYATRKRLGRTPTMEDMARIWNGGPDGWKKSSTLAYWQRVKKFL